MHNKLPASCCYIHSTLNKALNRHPIIQRGQLQPTLTNWQLPAKVPYTNAF